MKVLILGAGFTGQCLAQWLVQRNVEVLLSNRSGSSFSHLPCIVFPFRFSDNEPNCELSLAALDRVTHVISTIAPTPLGSDPLISYVIPMLDPQNIQWLGYLSTTGVYGHTQGQWVDEQSPVNPGNLRSQHRVTIEQQLLSSGLPIHIFRLPGIYGLGRSIFDRIKAGRAKHIIKPGHVFSRIHVDDIVQTLWASMQNPTPGEVYNIADDQPSEPRDLLLEGARLLGIEPPEPILFADASLSPMGQSFWQECRRVSNQKIKHVLGINLFYPSYKEGLRAILNA